jgi:hypothetical protein
LPASALAFCHRASRDEPNQSAVLLAARLPDRKAAGHEIAATVEGEGVGRVIAALQDRGCAAACLPLLSGVSEEEYSLAVGRRPDTSLAFSG